MFNFSKSFAFIIIILVSGCLAVPLRAVSASNPIQHLVSSCRRIIVSITTSDHGAARIVAHRFVDA